MSEEKYFDRVSRYFGQEMELEELKLFEADLKTDPGLAEAVRKYELSLETIDLLSEKKMKSDFRQWRQEAAQQNKEGRRVSMTSWRKKMKAIPNGVRAIAAVGLLLIAAYTAYNIVGTGTDEDYFASFEQPFSGDGIRSSQDASYADAMEAYQNKNYQEAIDHFTSVEKSNDQAMFYLAHSYFLNADYEASEKQFKQILALEESIFSEEAEWGLVASLYFQKDREKELKLLLNKMASKESHSFSEEAKKVLEEL